MKELFYYLFAFALFAVAAAGAARLFYITIQPGEIFGKWQRVLQWLDRRGYVFLYKSLGGCSTCWRQRWSELTFAVWTTLWVQKCGNWILHDVDVGNSFLTTVLRVIMAVVIYLLFCGTSFIIGNHLEHEKKIVDKLEDQYPDQQIKRQTAGTPRKS